MRCDCKPGCEQPIHPEYAHKHLNGTLRRGHNNPAGDGTINSSPTGPRRVTGLNLMKRIRGRANLPPTTHHVQAAAGTLSSAGAHVDPVDLPDFETLADLMCFVVEIKALEGSERHLAHYFNRLAPQPKLVSLDVHNSDQPVASADSEEGRALISWFEAVRDGAPDFNAEPAAPGESLH